MLKYQRKGQYEYDFFQKKQIILPSEKNVLRIVSPIENMIDIVRFELHLIEISSCKYRVFVKKSPLLTLIFTGWTQSQPVKVLSSFSSSPADFPSPSE